MTPPCFDCGGILAETRDGDSWSYRCTAHGCAHGVELAERLTLLTAPWTRVGAAAVLELLERRLFGSGAGLARDLHRLLDELRGGE